VKEHLRLFNLDVQLTPGNQKRPTTSALAMREYRPSDRLRQPG
jgi:hypothetical protein